MNDPVAITLSHDKHLSRRALAADLQKRGLIRSGWWFRLIEAPLVLAVLWSSEFLFGPKAMLQASTEQGSSLADVALMFVDDYALALDEDRVWDATSSMLLLQRARVTSFSAIAMSAPSGYGQELALGFLQEFERRVDWRMRARGVHPEQLQDVVKK